MFFTYNILLKPLDYSNQENRTILAQIAAEQAINLAFPVQMLRRKQYWAIELPAGCFLGDFRPGMVSREDELRVRDGLLARLHDANRTLSYASDRMIIQKNNRVFYHQRLIAALKDVDTLAIPAFFHAVYAYLLEAQKNPKLAKGKKERPYAAYEKNKTASGRAVRGPAWTPEEDHVLRQWFSQRTVGCYAGQHAPLTQEEWKNVLAILGPSRTPASIRQRMSMLNNSLRRELSVDGYIPRDKYREYFARVLGENPRRPRMAPSRRKPRRKAD